MLTEEEIADDFFTEEEIAKQEKLAQENLIRRQAIEKVIVDFFGKNETAKSLKKELDPMNKEIKTYFRSVDDTILTIDDIVAEYSVRAGSTSMSPDALLAKLKKLKMKYLIKKVEIVDLAAFEKMIYDQLLDASLFADCLVTGTETEVLVIKKQKAKKAEKE